MRRKILSITLCFSMIASMGLCFPKSTYAVENENEYIVVVNDNNGYEEFVEDYEDNIVETSENSNVLEDQNMTVVSATESEVNELQKDSDIIIEPNYVIQASGIEEAPEATEEAAEAATQEAAEEATEEAAEAATQEDAEEDAEEEIGAATGKAEEEEEPIIEEPVEEAAAGEIEEAVETTTEETTDEDTEEEIEEDTDGAELEVLPEDSLWHLDMMNVGASGNSVGDAGVKVALLDTGVAPGNALNLSESINLIPGEEEVEPMFDDLSGHGTALAQIIGAEDIGNGMIGVNPGVQLVSVKVLRDDMTGSISQVIEGIYWCIQNDVDVINMSFGMTADSEILHRAIHDAYESGITMIASAGNGGNDDAIEYPAAYEEVISVGSVDPNGQISEFSATGEELDVTAPGEYVPSVDMLDYVMVTDGTSVSCAEVAGVVSKLLEGGESSTEYIREVIKKSSRSLNEDNEELVNGAGIVDADYAAAMYTQYEGDEEDLDLVPYGTNEEAVQTCSEDVIAQFSKDDHTAVLDGINAFEQTVDEATLYKGLRCPDIPEYRDIISDVSANDTISTISFTPTQATNGFCNAVANTMYMYNLAKAIDDNGNVNYFPTLSHPMDGFSDELEHNKDLIQWCMAKLNENWTDSAFGFTGSVTAHKKAVFILGMAMHNAMDMYAHRACYKHNGVLTPVDKNDRDNINMYPDRYTVAKAVARKIYARWKNTNSDGTRKSASALVFKVTQHNVASSVNDGFAIVTYYTYIRFTGESMSTENKEWFRLRAARKKAGGSWYIVSQNKAALIDADNSYDNWRNSSN